MRLVFLLLIFLTQNVFALPLQLLTLPKNYSIELYAYPVPNARSMTLGPNNIVFVGSLTGNVYAIIPKGDHTKIITIASDLDMPNGVAFHKGSLFVAESKRILRYDDIIPHLDHPPQPQVISTVLPQNQKDHRWRYIAFGPDNKLYISIGVPCNVCLADNPLFGTIIRMDPDGKQVETYVKGIRMSVGFDWDPKTKKLWFTNNGRDWLGDNTPPDTLNYAPQAGMNFGFPYFDGENLPDPIYSKYHPNYDFAKPALNLPAHIAPLGMRFYQNQIFIAEHGSWNRSSKVGYQVIAVKLSGNKVISSKPFITGWLQGQKAWGRPVDLLVMPDGSLLISDDYAGAIYRVKSL